MWLWAAVIWRHAYCGRVWQRSYGGIHAAGGSGSGPMAVYMLQVGVAAVLWRYTCCERAWQQACYRRNRLVIAAAGLSLPQQACQRGRKLIPAAVGLSVLQSIACAGLCVLSACQLMHFLRRRTFERLLEAIEFRAGPDEGGHAHGG